MKIINKVLQKWRKLRKFQSSTFDTIARRKLIEDQNTILELSGRVQELQNEVDCMSDSKDFQDAESVHSGNSHASRPVSFPLHPIPEGRIRQPRSGSVHVQWRKVKRPEQNQDLRCQSRPSAKDSVIFSGGDFKK